MRWDPGFVYKAADENVTGNFFRLLLIDEIILVLWSEHYSITTRIKTVFRTGVRSSWCLRVHFPSQQGLRQTIFRCHILNTMLLIVYVPTQQDLRQLSDLGLDLGLDLEEYVPSQQGLRRMCMRVGDHMRSNHSVYSITTRIKTCLRTRCCQVW